MTSKYVLAIPQKPLEADKELLCDFVAVQPPLPLPLKERRVVDGAGDGRLM